MIPVLCGSRAAARVAQLSARRSQYSNLESCVERVIADIRSQGDRAVRSYAEKWDALPAGAEIRIPQDQLQAAWRSIDSQLRSCLEVAAANIRQFCERQKPNPWTRARGGIKVGQLVRPLDSVGCYVPGGRYPLISTLLMTVIPAHVAGVKRICIASPNPALEVLGAAAMLGIREFYRIGGAQAVAALAYGTESIPCVDKIVGPGNVYVTVAKKLVAFDCAIDFLAGPTEILIFTDTGKPDFIAVDLVAQAEHDPDALAVLITTRRRLADRVVECISEMVRQNETARQSLKASGVVLLAESRKQALDWANQIAPEHITVDERNVKFIRNAGSIFIGDYSAQAAGDYASGPNHVLPTAGAARFRGGLSVLDFVKLISIQSISRRGLQRIAPVIELLASKEGLAAHAGSVRLRLENA